MDNLRHGHNFSKVLLYIMIYWKQFFVYIGTPAPPSSPCNPSPCGVNAFCRERFDNAVCECQEEYRGNPYEGCYPECLVNSDCPKSQACIKTKCQDPCTRTCGIGAICTVSNHFPVCSCPQPTVGDAFTQCQLETGWKISSFSNLLLNIRLEN